MYFLGVKAAGAQGWQPYHHPVPLSWNLGTLTSWNLPGHSRTVTGLLYIFTVRWMGDTSALLSNVPQYCHLLMKCLNISILNTLYFILFDDFLYFYRKKCEGLGYDDVCCDTCSCNGGYQYCRGTERKVQVWWVRYIGWKEDTWGGKEAEIGVCLFYLMMLQTAQYIISDEWMGMEDWRNGTEGKEIGIFREKSVPLPLGPPQFLHGPGQL